MKIDREIKKRWHWMKARIKHNRYYVNRVENRFTDYLSFQEWAISADFRPEKVLDRKDPRGHYSPENCQFLTKSEHVQKSGREKRRFSDDQIKQIRILYKQGLSSYRLAKEFKYSSAGILQIVNHKTYRDVK